MRSKIIKIIIILSFFFLIGFSVSVATTKIEVESEIDRVSVYPDSALVERVSHLDLKEGFYEIIFTRIISEIDENSLRVSLPGEIPVRILGAQVKREYLEEIPSERIKYLNEEIQKLEKKIAQMKNFKSILSEKKKFINSVTFFSGEQISQDLMTKMPQISDLENLLLFLDTELKDIYSQDLDSELEIRSLNNKVETLKRELSQISGVQKKIKRSIIVELEVLAVPKEGTTDSKVYYLVKGAYWKDRKSVV